MLQQICCHAPDSTLNKGIQYKKKLHTNPSYSKNVIILGFGRLWLSLTSFIAEATKAGSTLD